MLRRNAVSSSSAWCVADRQGRNLWGAVMKTETITRIPVITIIEGESNSVLVDQIVRQQEEIEQLRADWKEATAKNRELLAELKMQKEKSI